MLMSNKAVAVSPKCFKLFRFRASEFEVILNLKIKILIPTIHLAIADVSDQKFERHSAKYFYVLFCITIGGNSSYILQHSDLCKI